MSELYIGNRQIVRAVEMDAQEYENKFQKHMTSYGNGYLVTHVNGTQAWRTAFIFEEQYRKVTEDEMKLINCG